MELQVLFIGNSYTHYNNMPRMVEQFTAGLDRPVRATVATAGGATLQRHWNNPGFRELLKSREWDIVILQEQSVRPVQSPRVFREYVELWADEARTAGARVILYLTWARKASPEKQDAYTESYREAARQCGATLAPVGEAWRIVRERHPEIELFAPDGSHPSPAGSYLAACVFYAAITGSSPVGLPHEIPALDLGADRALALQKAAAEAVERER